MCEDEAPIAARPTTFQALRGTETTERCRVPGSHTVRSGSGTAVSAGDEVLRIIRTDRVKVQLWIAPNRLACGEFKFEARIQQKDAGDRWVEAKVLGVSDLPHPRTGQYLVEVEVDNRDDQFRPGGFVRAQLTLVPQKDTPEANAP